MSLTYVKSEKYSPFNRKCTSCLFYNVGYIYESIFWWKNSVFPPRKCTLLRFIYLFFFSRCLVENDLSWFSSKEKQKLRANCLVNVQFLRSSRKRLFFSLCLWIFEHSKKKKKRWWNLTTAWVYHYPYCCFVN